jgi:hypothetical protein
VLRKIGGSDFIKIVVAEGFYRGFVVEGKQGI